MATITRAFEFDAAHRVMNEKVKCFNLHGHRFKVGFLLSHFPTLIIVFSFFIRNTIS